MVPLAPIESVNLSDRTIAVIKDAIITGELTAGEPLRDRELADRLGVSRTPVREALHRLEAAGLVRPRGRIGWEVSPFTEEDVRELFQLRLILEPAGVDALERNPSDEAIATVTGFFAEYEHPIHAESYADYFSEDDAFHTAIVRCSGNRRLVAYYAVLNDHINRGRYFLSEANASRVEDTLDEHREIVDAVRTHDFSRAREVLVAHLRTGEDLMVREIRRRLAAH